mgnify:FL=1
MIMVLFVLLVMHHSIGVLMKEYVSSVMTARYMIQEHKLVSLVQVICQSKEMDIVIHVLKEPNISQIKKSA